MGAPGPAQVVINMDAIGQPLPGLEGDAENSLGLKFGLWKQWAEETGKLGKLNEKVSVVPASIVDGSFFAFQFETRSPEIETLLNVLPEQLRHFFATALCSILEESRAEEVVLKWTGCPSIFVRLRAAPFGKVSVLTLTPGH